MKNAKEISQQFLKDYEQNPLGWSYWITQGKEFYNIYIIRENTGYFMKIDSIYTQNPLGVGTKLEVEEEIEGKLPGFGFREFNQKELKAFMENISDKQQAQELIQRKMKQKPRDLESIGEKQPPLVMLGPIHNKQPFSEISSKHQKIDKKLTRELRKKFQRNNPAYR